MAELFTFLISQRDKNNHTRPGDFEGLGHIPVLLYSPHIGTLVLRMPKWLLFQSVTFWYPPGDPALLTSYLSLSSKITFGQVIYLSVLGTSWTSSTLPSQDPSDHLIGSFSSPPLPRAFLTAKEALSMVGQIHPFSQTRAAFFHYQPHPWVPYTSTLPSETGKKLEDGTHVASKVIPPKWASSCPLNALDAPGLSDCLLPVAIRPLPLTVTREVGLYLVESK
jgi:hypothetical protein